MRHLRSDWDTIQPQPGQTSIEIDEPCFVLRAADPSAPATVRAWADDVEDRGGDEQLVARVRAWASEMEAWRMEYRPDKQVADVPEGHLR